MREAAQEGTFPGRTYQVALSTYGRGIEFVNLDTSVLSCIVLFDQYFQKGQFKVQYSNYETDLIRRLHKLRNRIGHEEGNVELTEKAKKETMSLLRGAVDYLNLIEYNPQLATGILKEYLSRSSIPTFADGRIQEFVELSAKFEQAESLFRWHIEESLPIYMELADKNYVPAMEKLLFIYTQTSTGVDIEKAVKIAEQLHKKGKCSRDKLLRFREFQRNKVLALIGDLESCRYVAEELNSEEIVMDPKLLKYALDTIAMFPKSIPSLGLDSYYATIHGLGYEDLKELRDQNDPEAYAETAYRMIYQKNTDFNKAKRCADKASSLGSVRGMLLSELLLNTGERDHNVNRLVSILAGVAREGFLPGIEYFAEAEKEGTAASRNEQDPGMDWIKLGVDYGSTLCQTWYDGIHKKTSVEIPSAKSEEGENSWKPNGENQLLVRKSEELSQLREQIRQKNRIIRIMAIGIAGLIILQLIQFV